MAVQPPFRSDAFRVENADAPPGPRLIEADTSDGSLRFTDPRAPSGVTLAELAGLQQTHNTIVVSQTGIGASKDANGDPITTIQGGLDAVPNGADVDNPWTVLVAPGLYQEDIYFLKDGTTLQGIGTCRLRNATDSSTIRIRAGVPTTPRRISIVGMRIENTNPLQACVDASSATFASGMITIASVPNCNDMVEVGGVTLTAVLNGSTPSPGEFELGTDTDTTAENLAAALSDPANGLTGIVTVFVTGSIITIRALEDGVAGNAITLSSTVPLVIMVSGPTLVDGSDESSGSAVGENLIRIVDCDLVAISATGLTIRASAVNNIYARGGDWTESATGTLLSVSDCASFRGVALDVQGVALNYDATNPNLPLIATSSYQMNRVSVGATGVVAGFVNVGSLSLSDCSVAGSCTYSGDDPAQSFTATRCSFGVFIVGGAAPETVLRDCTRGALLGAGTGTLAESISFGSATFAASASVSVTFPEPQPDTNYVVLVEQDGPPAALTDIAGVPSASKTVTGFDIDFGAPQTLTLNYVVRRDV